MTINLQTVEKIEPYEDQSNGSPINRTSMNTFIINSSLPDQDPLQPDVDMAKRFLTLIANSQETPFTFQIFSDKKDVNLPAQVLSGSIETLEETLVRSNQAGSGVFVTINQTDGRGRKTENIVQVRAVFVDLDGSPIQPILDAPLSPHVVIESSPGRYHAYWVIEGLDREHFSSVQKQLIERFQADPQVHDLARVMRLPGFYHQKGAPFLTKIIEESGEQSFSLQAFLDAFGITLTPPTVTSQAANPVLEVLTKHQMIIGKPSHPAGCWTIRCPWGHLHSKQDLGTKYFEPHTKGYSTHGFKCFHKHCEARTSQDLLAYLGMPDSESIEPLPLHRELGEAKPYPFDALGSILGPAAQALQKVIKAPDAICAQSVLAAAALATQPYANVLIDGREMPLSLFFITIAESGDRKSATDRFALRSISDWQKMLTNSYREEVRKFYLQKESWEIRKREWMRTNQDPTAIFDESLPPPPLRPLLLVEEPTYEGIVKYFAAEGQPSIGLFSDEGGRFFGGHAMKQENCMKTIAGLSSLWDGKPITRMRFGDGDMLMYGRRLSVHLMVQEMIMTQLMGNSLFDLQGFLPRCLIAFPSSTAGKRMYVEEDLSTNINLEAYWKILNDLLNRPFPVDPPPALQNELKPRSLTLSPQAKQTWIEFHNALDTETAEGKRWHVIRRFASKAAEHVLRLSGVLTLIEEPDAVEIGLECLQRGICLIEYYLEERLRIQGFISINPDLSCAASLLKWFWNQGYSQIGLTTVYQYGPLPLGIRNAERARSIMAILTTHGWATPNPNIIIEGKKNREAWTIKPQQPESC